MAAATTRGASGPWRPAEAARPLRCWSQAQHEVLAGAVEAALRSWQNAWGLRADLRSRCEEAGDGAVAQGGWRALAAAGESMAWMRAPAAPQALAPLLLGGPGCTPLGCEIVQACLADAQARVAEVLGLPRGAADLRAPSAADVAPWSGALELTFTGALDMGLLLGGGAVEAWWAGRAPVRSATANVAPPPLSPVRDALAAQSARLQVRLRGCELGLGRVQELRVGDVIRLRHPLEAPALLVDATGAALLGGYLGRSRDRKAVALVHKPADGPADPPTTQGPP